LLLALLLRAVRQLGNEKGLCLELLNLFTFFVGDAVCNAMPDRFGCGLVPLVMLSEFFLYENPEVHKCLISLGLGFVSHSRRAGSNSPDDWKVERAKANRKFGFFACPTFNN
jgi:hypothetical protein